MPEAGTLDTATRARIVQALTPFVGRPITSDLVDAMADALWELVTPKPVWIGVDMAKEDVEDIRSRMLRSAGPGGFRHLFQAEIHRPTPEDILDEQWLAIMNGYAGLPVLVVMRQADYEWLAQVRQAANCSSDPHLWANTYRGLPIQIDDEYDRPKVFTEAQARRQGLRW